MSSSHRYELSYTAESSLEIMTEMLTSASGCYQGKEYVFIANSDNLGAIVDLSIQTYTLHQLFFKASEYSCTFKYVWVTLTMI